MHRVAGNPITWYAGNRRRKMSDQASKADRKPINPRITSVPRRVCRDSSPKMRHHQ